MLFDRRALVAFLGSEEAASKFESDMSNPPIIRESSGIDENPKFPNCKIQLLGPLTHSYPEAEYLEPEHIQEKQDIIAPLVCTCDAEWDIDPIVKQRILDKDQEKRDVLFLTRRWDDDKKLTQRYTCITSSARFSFSEALCGFNWVAVHGIKSICVATRITDLERESDIRLAMCKQMPETSLGIFRNGIIGKVKGFLDKFESLPNPQHQILTKPFGVVSSVVPYTKNVRKRRRHDQALAFCGVDAEQNAIAFVRESLEATKLFTYNLTVKTAIGALRRMFNQELEAKELQVFVWKKKDGGEPKALTDVELKEHIADLRGGFGNMLQEEEDLENEEIREIREAMNDPMQDSYDKLKDMGEEMRAYIKMPLCKLHCIS